MSKSIIITGCSTGFGYDAAKHFAKSGNQVYATMRNIESKNAQAANELKEFASSENVNLKVIELDVSSDQSVASAISQIPEADVLINNAGLGYGGPLESFTSEQFVQQLDVNIVGTFRLVKAVLPDMRARKSALIIQVSSIAGRISLPGFGVYCASKWGLESYSESLRYELAPHGIDVVIVQPGPFATSFLGNVVPAENEEIASAYQHVGEFSEGFGKNMMDLYEDENSPTDPMIVVDIFEKLIETPSGQRPLRTIAGLDFGASAINDATDPLRTGILNELEIGDWDGPR